ncbi:hypothetical protein AGMMS4952_05780 [Spirochaetia bacterium]|nr:hypothetical protein AGMMS4952_05780 [Spirochaetia bacterium]
MIDDASDEEFCSGEVHYSEKAIRETIIAEEANNNIAQKMFGIRCKPFIIKLIAMNESSKTELATTYRDYLNNNTKLRTAQKHVSLVEYNFEQLLREYKEPESKELSQTQIKHYISHITAGIKDAIDFHKGKLEMQEYYDAKGNSGKTTIKSANSNAAASDSAIPSGKETEEITPEMPCVIQDLLQNSGLLETKRDATGRFKPHNGINDKALIHWIYDNSSFCDELTANVYAEYIYTVVKQATLEDYMRLSRRN